jgi:hypothetical protein
MASIPDSVKSFIQTFYQAVKENQLLQINQHYDNHWGKLTEKYFKQAEWPSAATISPLVNDGTKTNSCNMADIFAKPDELGSVLTSHMTVLEFAKLTTQCCDNALSL